MPFCSTCGNQIGDNDVFCGKCGTRQPHSEGATKTSRTTSSQSDPFEQISPRTFSILCYIPVAGIGASIYILAAKRFRSDRTLRFHAFQSFYIFVAWLLVHWVISPLFSSFPHGVVRVDEILKFLLITVWVIMLIKTSKGQTYSLPIVGELAQRSVEER